MADEIHEDSKAEVAIENAANKTTINIKVPGMSKIKITIS